MDNKNFVFEGEKTDKPKVSNKEGIEDKSPVEKYADQINALEHEQKLKSKKIFYVMSMILVVLAPVFLIILFLFVLPISRMEPHIVLCRYEFGFWTRFWTRTSEWASAFLETSSAFGMTLAAIIVSELLKKALVFIAKYEKEA